MKAGHFNLDPTTSAYAGVVSREIVRVALTYIDLMVLDVMESDIWNAYFQSPLSESNYIICGPEFGLGKCWQICFNQLSTLWGKSG